EHMNNPEFIRINPEQVAADKIQQELYHVGKDEKISLLLGLLKSTDQTRTIIFVNTKRTAEQVYGYLAGNDFNAAILSGDVPQKKRQRLFREFSEGKLPLLVATDLAARGLHIPDVSHVFNFDLPQNPEDYIHRIGRTARAGASGNAVSFACEEYVYSLIEIEELLGHKIDTVQVSNKLLLTPKPPIRIKTGRQRRGNPGHESKRRHHHKPRSGR
ncbi:MAG: RNA helicase, partial [Thiotrichales bacterium]|nr:RNA helicase [Thiotrichales bacterium]